MPRYKMVVFSKAKEGRDKEYNDWYNNVHLAEITSIKGVKSGQRFGLTLNLTQSAGFLPYLAIYDIETDDLKSVIQQMTQGGQPSDALDTSSAALSFYEESGALVYHKG
ncbi:MAG: hypothetical protein EPO08_14945 [Rhodospirillaceae bacterium]|nr:MAG: hypothetical protein EPO08_14945 [Rhodospirillaceae bacterium]